MISECLAKEYEHGLTMLNLNCTTPWSQSILGNTDYTDSNPCNNIQYKKEHNFSAEMFVEAARNDFEKCPSKCNRNHLIISIFRSVCQSSFLMSHSSISTPYSSQGPYHSVC